MCRVKALEEGHPLDPGQSGGSGVEQRFQAERAQCLRGADQVVEQPDDREVLVVVGCPPVERPGVVVGCPCREQAVEQGLDQGGPEQVLTVPRVECDAERPLQGRPERAESGQVGPGVKPQECVPGIGSQEEGHVLGPRQRGAPEQAPLQEVRELLAESIGPGAAGQGPERCRGSREVERLPGPGRIHQAPLPEVVAKLRQVEVTAATDTDLVGSPLKRLL